jgi:tetratricopeptide (TPR) repeat protein
LYLRADIGKHREEIYARKMARLANLQPNDLYIKAINLYIQGNYWDAFFIFSQLFVEYPDFFKNDWVSYFLGSCQEELDMRLTAEEAYKKTKELYPRSAAVPAADLGLMRVYYRDANFGAVESQFNELNKLGVPDSIKYHGYYYMGETEMKKENFSKAKQLFDLIPETHPDYVFAQHSAAVCNATTDNIEGAISSLENCIQAHVTTDAQKEIVSRSYVFIGYIFYEELTEQEGPLAKAVTAFRMVPKTSFYYVDALLGLAWTALKARQWGDCKAAGQELQSITKSPVMKAEGGLLQAYAFMMEKNYNSAATILADASGDLESYKAPSQAELMSRQDESNALRGKYTEVARKAYDLGTSRQSDIVLKQIDSLHTHQKNIKTKIDDFLTYVDNYDQAVFFARNFESIKEDVEYALARAEKLGGQVQEKKVIEKFKKEDEKIDDELEKLKAQLEKEQEKADKKDGKKEKIEPEPEPEPLPDEDLLPEDLPDEEGWE